MENVISRLEAVAVRLEAVSNKSSRSTQEEDSESVEALIKIISSTVSQFVTTSKSIDTEVGELAALLVEAFNKTVNIVKTASVTKKPADQQKLATLMQPLSTSIEAITKFAESHFKSSYRSHLEAISGYASCFGWINATGKPGTYVGQCMESGAFYSNRVLTQFKEKGSQHKQFVTELKKCFEELLEYTKEFHGNGLFWNMAGGKEYEASTSQKIQSTQSIPATKPTTKTATPGALFSEINKGTNISSGLRKVDDSQKTHKNPALRSATSVVSKSPKPTSTVKATTTQTREPKTELVGKKWIYEFQNNTTLTLEEGDISYTVSLFNCKNTNLIISPKMNSVSLEKCENCKIQLKAGLISFIEVTNCKKIDIQADLPMPFVNVNSCDAIQIYLTPSSKDTQVSTNTSTGVNVCFFSEETDLIEYPVPEMFVSFIKDGKLVTEISKNI